MQATFPKRSLVQLGVTAILVLLPTSALPADDDEATAKFSPEAAATFNKRCTACHTYGKGIKVGPDLKGVNDRRKREWLLRFIHASSTVIKSGDPTAARLFAEFKQQRMPDWTDLSEQQIRDILDYIGVGGPDIRPVDERNAEGASTADIDAGKKLFAGDMRFKSGAQACAACHSIQGAGLRGGTLGPDLTNIYPRYQDIALTAFLRHPCFPWKTEDGGDNYLAARESFAVKAFLRSASLNNERKTTASRQDKPPVSSSQLTREPAAAAPRGAAR